MRDYTIQLAGKDIPARGLWSVLFHKEKPDSAAESHFRDRCSELLNLAAAIQEAEGNHGNVNHTALKDGACRERNALRCY